MNQPESNRQIRVFISSTFRDMQAERDHLVKFIFPQLRNLCESRGVTWGEVDLRWGVTDEQAAEGKVLPICLEEIKRCRPYFIGLLGERYGWIPESIPAEVIEREPWLKEHLHGKKSVTELEIIHGVLREEKMHGHAFFYFRDPAFIESIPPEQRQKFVTEDAESAEKLRRLKELIRHAQREEVCSVRENYPDPKALGELVLADLTRVINELFPEGSQPDPLDREAMDHETYAQSRERVYIGRQEYFDRLDAYVVGRVPTHGVTDDKPETPGEGTGPTTSDNTALVILGESGSGKSALLANWVARYRQAHPDALVLQHYIGATPYSADWAAMLRRLMGEFKRRLGIQQDIPDQADALRSAFPNWLYMANARVRSAESEVRSPAFTRPGPPEGGTPSPPSKIIIVLDALNQLEDRDGAPDLVWLPPALPENVRIIVSTLPGRPLDEIQKRHWPTLKVELLSADERRILIAEYLAQHAKSLNTARVERIAASPQSANPLYLRVLLDELRLVRAHEELEERIGDYLKAESPYALYEKVIARWEQDYEGESDLVGDTLSLLWASRRGLTETELLRALGKDGEPLPRAKWSPLFLAMSDALISRGGLLTFAHDFLRTAVKNAYLPTERNQQQAHMRLVGYFAPRAAEYTHCGGDLIWYLTQASAWQALCSFLTDPFIFQSVWLHNPFEVRMAWSRIEAASSYRIVDAFRSQIEHPESESEMDKHFLWCLSSLLDEVGHPNESLRLQSHLETQFGTEENPEALAQSLLKQGDILFRQGNPSSGMELYKKAEELGRRSGNLDTIQAALGGQADILYKRGKLDLAMSLHKEAAQIWRRVGNLGGLKATLGRQALILQDSGDLDGAIALHKEEERICRRLGDLDGLESALGNHALILKARGDFNGAVALHKEEERICRELGNLAGLQASLSNQAGILLDHQDLEASMALLTEQEQICRRLENLDGLSDCLGNQALVLAKAGAQDEAMTLLKEQEQICRNLDNLAGLARCLGNQANNLARCGRFDEAITKRKEDEQICRQVGNVEGLTIGLFDQALDLLQAGRECDALKRAEEAYQLAVSHGYTTLVEHIESKLNIIRQAAQNIDSTSSPKPSREATIPELRDSAAAALKRGLWEAAETYLEKLLQQGEPVETVAPDLITALLNAHETVSPRTVTRIETLLAQLDSAGHTALAAPVRERLTTKLATSQPKKPWWQFGR